MARIDTLPNFLTDVADAIRTKTGSENLIAPEEYDTEIESIQGGLDIQNGRIANYKATSGTVPAGTFVKLNTSYQLTTVSSTGGYFSGSTPMGDNLFVQLTTSLSNYNYYTRLRLYQITASGIIKKAELGDNVYSPDYRFKTQGFGIDDSHFILFGTSANNDNLFYYHIGTYAAGSLSLGSSKDASAITKLTSNVSGYPTGFYKTEDENYIYIHIPKSFYNSNSSSTYYGSGIACVTIDKSTYAVTGSSGISAESSFANYKKYLCTNFAYLGNNKFIGTRYSNEGIIVFTFDPQTKTYTAVNSTGDTLNAYGGKKGYFVILNGTLYFIYAYSTTILHYAKLTFDDNTNKVTLVEDNELFSSSTAVFNNIAGYQVQPDSNTLLLGLIAGSNAYGLVIKATNSGLTTGSLIQLNTENIVTSGSGPNDLYWRPFDICNGNIINQMLTTGDSSNGYQSKPIKMCLCTVDDYLSINQASGSSITVQTTTGTIQGLTKTDCTVDTAGEVYLLDNSN